MQFQRLGTAACAALLALGAAIPVSAATLLPHRATYVLSLVPDNEDSQISAVDGLMIYDFKDVCDGWATDLKMKVVVSFDSGDTRTVETSQVTWEAKDGHSYRYLIKNGSGEGESDQLRGEATIDAATGKATVTSDLPTKAEAQLPTGTMFPVAQTDLMLTKAAAGDDVVTAEVFDGTVPNQSMQESALIGPAEKNWPGLPKKIPELQGLNSYPVGLAYYIGDKTDAVPDSEQSMRLYENGVVGQLDFDLGEGPIKIRAVLDQLKLQPAPAC